MIKFLKYFLVLFIMAALSGCSFNHYQNTKFDYNDTEKYQKQIERVQKSCKNIRYTIKEELHDDDLSPVNNPILTTEVFIKGDKYKRENYYTPQKNNPGIITPMGEVYGNNKKGIEYSHFRGLDFIVENKKEKNEPISKVSYINFCTENQKREGKCKWQFLKKAVFGGEECSLFENIYYDFSNNITKIQNCYSEKYGIIIYHAYLYNGERFNTIQTEKIEINKVKRKDIKPPKLHIISPKKRK